MRKKNSVAQQTMTRGVSGRSSRERVEGGSEGQIAKQECQWLEEDAEGQRTSRMELGRPRTHAPMDFGVTRIATRMHLDRPPSSISSSRGS